MYDISSWIGKKNVNPHVNSCFLHIRTLSEPSVTAVLFSHLSCSNPVVQVEATESGALQRLLTILATEQPIKVKKKVLTHLPYISRCLNTHTHTLDVSYQFVNCSVCVSGSVCTGVPPASLPVRPESLCLTWWAPGPVKAVSSGRRWAPACPHRHHAL